MGTYWRMSYTVQYVQSYTLHSFYLGMASLGLYDRFGLTCAVKWLEPWQRTEPATTLYYNRAKPVSWSLISVVSLCFVNMFCDHWDIVWSLLGNFCAFGGDHGESLEWLGGAPGVIKVHFSRNEIIIFKHVLTCVGRSRIHAGVYLDNDIYSNIGEL